MTFQQLHEYIITLIKTVDDYPTLPVLDPNLIEQTAGFDAKWKRHILNQVVQMEMVEELDGTPAGKDLLQAILYADSYDYNSFDKMFSLLIAVDDYMKELAEINPQLK
jgi:hypothetical protein